MRRLLCVQLLLVFALWPPLLTSFSFFLEAFACFSVTLKGLEKVAGRSDADMSAKAARNSVPAAHSPGRSSASLPKEQARERTA